jgi:hypothetical protein
MQIEVLERRTCAGVEEPVQRVEKQVMRSRSLPIWIGLLQFVAGSIIPIHRVSLVFLWIFLSFSLVIDLVLFFSVMIALGGGCSMCLREEEEEC